MFILAFLQCFYYVWTLTFHVKHYAHNVKHCWNGAMNTKGEIKNMPCSQTKYGRRKNFMKLNKIFDFVIVSIVVLIAIIAPFLAMLAY